MRRKNIIDYELNPQLTKDLQRYLKEQVLEIFGKQINEDYYDYLEIITSKEHKETIDQQKQDIKEAFEQQDAEKVDKLVSFLHNDYVKKYEELLE